MFTKYNFPIVGFFLTFYLSFTGNIKGNKLKFLNSNFGDWFVLHQVYKNIQHTNFAQLISKLCGPSAPPLRRNETNIFYAVNEPNNGLGAIEYDDKTSNHLMDKHRNGWSIQEQLHEQRKKKFDVGSTSSTDTLVGYVDETSSHFMGKDKKRWSIQEQLQEQQKKKFGSTSSFDTAVNM